MHDLNPLSALGKSRAQIDSRGAVMCEERADVALASVTARLGQEGAARTALADLLGVPAPDVSQSGGAAGIAALWVGPDQWLLEASYVTHEDLAAQAKTAVGDAASVTEQSDALTRFDLTGAEIHAVLELLTPLDTGAMAPGTAARTPIHHLTCTLLLRAANHVSIYAPRASAKSIHHAITTAMKAAL